MNEPSNYIGLESDSGNLEMELNFASHTIQRIYSKDTNELESTALFQDTWINDIKKNQNALLPIAAISRNKVWFEYLKNSNHPIKSKYM